MANFDVMQTSFLGGEISPRAYGRLDLELYKYGCSAITNFIVRPHGGVSRRGGTRFVATAKYSDKVAILQDYSNRDNDNYVLEWGDYYLRFYISKKSKLLVLVIPYAHTYVRRAVGMEC